MQSTPRVIEVLEDKILGTDDEAFKAELLEAIRVLNSYALPEAYRKEVEYVFEMMQENEDEDYQDIILTQDDIDCITDGLWNNEWLNDQVYDCVREGIHEYLAEREGDKGDDFNE